MSKSVAPAPMRSCSSVPRARPQDRQPWRASHPAGRGHTPAASDRLVRRVMLWPTRSRSTADRSTVSVCVRSLTRAEHGVFHATMTAAADEFVGMSKRSNVGYGLAYYSVSHRWLREICIDIVKSSPPARYRPVLPSPGFKPDLQVYARGAVERHELRHAAADDPTRRFAS